MVYDRRVMPHGVAGFHIAALRYELIAFRIAESVARMRGQRSAGSDFDTSLKIDLPLNFHPAAVRASAICAVRPNFGPPRIRDLRL